MFILAICYRLLGRRICLFLSLPIVFYFYMTGASQRNASRVFLTRIFKIKKLKRKVNFFDVFYHFLNFFGMMLDKISAALGESNAHNIKIIGDGNINKMMENNKEVYY